MPLPPNILKASYATSSVPEYQGNPFIEALPPIMNVQAVRVGLESNVTIDKQQLFADSVSRVHSIAGLMNRFFQPLTAHVELEEKLSLLIRQGYVGRNCFDGSLNQHLQAGYERLQKGDVNVQTFNQVRSTATSFALIGGSGCGKSATLERLLATYPQVLFHEELNVTQIVYLKIDSPHDGTLKSLCLHFFRAIDRAVGTNYETLYGKTRLPIETLMASMTQLANLYALGVLIIDEIQHLSTAKSGGQDKMLNFFVTLVNTIGVPVLLVGTPKAQPIFVADFRAARRTTGFGAVYWGAMKGDPSNQQETGYKEWVRFTDKLWKYQWLTKADESITEEIRDCWFDLSQGIHDIVVKLFVFAQLRAIATKTERITTMLLRQVYEDELKPVHPMLEALRKDDPDEIVQYSDLYVPDVEKRLLEIHEKIEVASQTNRFDQDAYAGNSEARHLHNILESMGFPADRTQELVLSAFEQYPEADLSVLMPIVLEWYKEWPTQLQATANRKTYIKQMSWNELKTDDLRFQYSQRTPKDTVYELAKKRGMVFDMNRWLHN